MFIQNRKKIIVLTLSLVLGIRSNVFAMYTPEFREVTQPINKTEKQDESIRHPNKFRDGQFKGLSSIEELKLTTEDIENAKKSGKTIFDIEKEKNDMSPDQVRSIIIKAKTDNINNKVTEGKLNREKADEIISKMKLNIEKWDGNFNSCKKNNLEEAQENNR
ncbi:hypothetical protein [Clostridium lundense]|uniref:hypothetical protein n=1 Tax=Clostridium lundense TaxID=319475 RepID=UPI000483C6E2|nr:hypothetical protein [Clostridium lundense]